MNKLAVATLSLGVFLTGCATQPDKLTASYVSPLKYNQYDCDQVIMEMDHVSRKTASLYQSLDKKADDDAAQMGIGLVLFWPTLFLLEGGDGPEAVEYASLKGDYEALRTTSVQKKCGADNLPKSPDELITEIKAKKEKTQKTSSADDASDFDQPY